jgi:hypothetical protein
MYYKHGEWSGFTIHPSKTGWIIDSWSRIQGEMTDTKTLVNFDDQFPKDMDLFDVWNDTMFNGDALSYYGQSNGKILRKGFIVE